MTKTKTQDGHLLETICNIYNLNEDQFLISVFNESFQFISILDPHGNIIKVNRTTLDFGQTDIERVEGKPFWNAPWCHLTRDEQKTMQAEIKRASRGEIVCFKTFYTSSQGERIDVDCSLKPIKDKTGKVIFLIKESRDISGYTKEKKELHELATHDPLTQLPNRRLLNDRLNHAIQRAQRSNQTIAVLFLDIDGFKAINDTHGHDVGDSLLKFAAARLKSCSRESDTISRIGGDEFIFILENIPKNEDIITVSQRICETIAKPYFTGQVSITASIGISIFPFDGQTGEVLIKKADRAMYDAKNSGKNRFQFYKDEREYIQQEKKTNQKVLINNVTTMKMDSVSFFQKIVDELEKRDNDNSKK
ncbi:MAG: sensor domain-containing diguanylate cyclase [bacterium]|nr:sensor domain-containing diguanylate cyclase [bacterium]